MKGCKSRLTSLTLAMMSAALLAGLAATRLEAQSSFAGDIVCLSTRKPYLVPSVCEKACPSHATLANLNALNYGGVNGRTFCDLKPVTPALADDRDLQYHYDRAVWGKILGGRRIPPDPPKPVLVAHILNSYYPPYKASTLGPIEFGPSKEHWAGLTPASGPGAKPVLTVNEDLFWLTPAFLVSTLGHEMVHMDQYRRRYTTNLTGINDAVAALREVEAYSWQLQKDTFPRTFKVTPGRPRGSLFPFMQDSERAETHLNFDCYQWKTRRAIEAVVTGPRKQVYAKTLAAWLQEDPWVRQVWLPQNPGWATQQAGPKPAGCR